jgi:hypothetical protein
MLNRVVHIVTTGLLRVNRNIKQCPEKFDVTKCVTRDMPKTPVQYLYPDSGQYFDRTLAAPCGGI